MAAPTHGGASQTTGTDDHRPGLRDPTHALVIKSVEQCVTAMPKGMKINHFQGVGTSRPVCLSGD